LPQFLRRPPNITSALLSFFSMCRLSTDSVSRTLLNPSGPVQTCIGTAVPSLALFYCAFDSISLFAHCSLPTIRHEVTSNTTEIYKKLQSFETISLFIYLYCCTVHFEDSPIIKNQQMHYFVFCYSKTRIKTLQKLLHVLIHRSSSGSTRSSLLKLF
jgi:hypothetical protein